MKRVALALVSSILVATPVPTLAGKPAAAATDLVFINGHVITLDPSQPAAEAVAVHDGKVTVVGDNASVLAAVKGQHPRTIDLKGRTLVPGLADAHVHPMEGAFLHQRLCDVRALTVEEGLQKLKHCADIAPAGDWVVGYDWYDLDNPGFDSITRAQMDAIAPQRKVAVIAHDHHTVWANSRLLESVGIKDDTPSPPGGDIVRDPVTHKPTGMLIDAAHTKVIDEIEHHSTYSASVRELLQTALNHLNTLGITSIVDAMANDERVSAYVELERAGQLTARVTIAMPVVPANFRTEIPRIAALRASLRSENVHIGFIKVFGDGNPEVGLSSFLNHDGKPGTKSAGYYTDDEMHELVALAERYDLPVFVHVIGDGAARQVLDAIADARRVRPVTDLRHTLTHLCWVDSEDLPRFRALGVIANVQEGWMAPAAFGGPPGYDYARSTAAGPIGPWLAGRLQPYRDIADAGAMIASGSDWFYTDENPWNDLEAGSTSMDPGGTNPLPMLPNQTIDVARLLAARTTGNAYQVGRETELGMIRPGFRADLVVVDRNPLAVPPRTLHETRVDLTVLEGRIVYER